MTYECQAYLQAALPVLGIRARTPVEKLPETLGKCYGSIGQYLAGLGQAPAGCPYVAYFNMDMQDLEIEAGFPVAGALAGKDAIQAGTLPNKMVATTTFTGPYTEMGPAYQELTHWIEEQGYQANGVVYEFYLNDPATTPPEALQTQIVFILKN
jgi:effector-binding domain-containing protein